MFKKLDNYLRNSNPFGRTIDGLDDVNPPKYILPIRIEISDDKNTLKNEEAIKNLSKDIRSHTCELALKYEGILVITHYPGVVLFKNLEIFFCGILIGITLMTVIIILSELLN
jgi:hypothetical protein